MRKNEFFVLLRENNHLVRKNLRKKSSSNTSLVNNTWFVTQFYKQISIAFNQKKMKRFVLQKYNAQLDIF